ncbi:MAG: alpha-2-macroglobulin family protein [Gemmatimonas sp.]
MMHWFRFTWRALARSNTICAAASVLALALASRAPAQTPLRVLRYSPTDTATSSGMVTVTFSRPVAGMLDHTVDARKILSVTPGVDGTFEWRDPITLRFIPKDPIPPGTNLVLAIDTASLASGGRRRGARYTFTLHVPPTRRVSLGVDGQVVGSGKTMLGPLPTFFATYSGSVSTDSIAQLAHMQFPAACGGNIPLRAVRERAFRKGDPRDYYVERNSDSLALRFWRVVEMVPVDSLKAGCSGSLVVPLVNDARGRDSDSHAVTTFPEFRIDSVVPCLRGISDGSTTACVNDGVVAWFSTPLDPTRAAKSITVSPELKPLSLGGRVHVAGFRGATVSRDKYTVTVDSSMRDIFGRRLTGPNIISAVVRDRSPSVQYQTEMVSITTALEPFRIRTVNVDTLTMYVTAIPDSAMVALLNARWIGASSSQYPVTATVDVPVNGAFNKEVSVEAVLPSALRNSATLFGIVFTIKAASIPSDSIAGVKARRADSLRIAKAMHNTNVSQRPALGMLAQVNNLRAHAKLVGNHGAVFITDVAGAPVTGASAVLLDENQRRLAIATTGTDGLAEFHPTPTDSLIASAKLFASRSRNRMRFLDVKHGAERLVIPVEAVFAKSFGPNSASGWQGYTQTGYNETHGALTSDRDIYRPGEVVFVKSFVRTGMVGSIVTPVADSVQFKLRRDDYTSQDSEYVRTALLGTFGTATDSIRLPLDASVGEYILEAKVRTDGAWHYVANPQTIKVAEFRAPEFLVTVAGDTANSTIRDSAKISVTAKYLFGSPMAGAKVQWTASADAGTSADIAIPNTQSYAIGQRSWWDPHPPPAYLRFGAESALNARGELALKIPANRDTLDAFSRLKIEVAVIDVNGRAVTASTSVSLQKSAYFVGAKRHDNAWYWRTGTAQTIDAIVVNKSGARIAGVPMDVAVIRRTWRADSTKPLEATRWRADTVQRLRVISTANSVPIRFTPQEDGAYDVRVSARDSLGRAAVTNVGQWAFVSAWVPGVGEDPAKLAISTQHRNGEWFSIGDTARVSFESPFDRATAWITIEREGILEQRTVIATRGSNEFRIPVTRRFAPNVWIGVTVIAQPGAGVTSANGIEEAMRIGYTELRVDSTAHALRVVVQPLAAQLQPADSAQVRVSVKEVNTGAGVRSEVALWAVDEGVLSLTDFKTPDILAELDERLGVAPRLYTTLTQLPWRTDKSGAYPGNMYDQLLGGRAAGVNRLDMMTLSDGNSTGNIPSLTFAGKTRAGFRFTAFFVGNAVTDNNGVATIHAKLPDNITTFRLMATAVTAGEGYGSGQASLLVTRSVVVRPSLPRIVRVGDTVIIGALLNLRNNDSATLNVRTRLSQPWLLSDSMQQIAISAGSTKRTNYQFAVPAHTRIDNVSVFLSAVGRTNRMGDAVETVLPIKPAGSPRSHTAIGMVRDSGRIVVKLPSDIDPSRSTFSVSLGTSPLVAMRANFARLQDYGNFSTELIVTTARSLLAISRAERSMNESILAKDSAAIALQLQSAVTEITKREDGDGRFSNWSGSQQREGLWFSTYVGQFLLEVKEERIEVADEVLENIKRAAEDYLVRQSVRFVDSVNFSPSERRYLLGCQMESRLAALQFLREYGQPNTAAEDSMLVRVKDLFWEDRVLLSQLLTDRPDKNAQARELLEDAWRGVSVAGKRIDMPDSLHASGMFPSHIRPAARLLTATMALMPDHPLLGALTETVIQQGAAERGWAWNSLDYGAAVEALGKFVETQDEAPDSRVVARDNRGRIVFAQNTGTASRKGMTSPDSLQTLQGMISPARGDTVQFALSIRMEGEDRSPVRRNAPLYYSVTVNEIPRQRPVTPDVAGITVERWYERFEDGKPVTELKEGDLVRVRMRITVPSDRQYVTVEDLLPAALEVVDLSLRTSSALGPFGKVGATRHPSIARDSDDDDAPFADSALNGSWDNGWWTPWDYRESRDDRVFYYARQLWSGTYSTSYLARATAAGTFVRPPAHAEEMYNRAVQGRSDGGVLRVRRRLN